MPASRLRLAFLNLGHAYDHLLMLLFATAVLGLEAEFGYSYGELLSLSVPGFVAFAAGTLPAGWLGDRWSRDGMMAVFFFGVGAAAVLTGLARSVVELAAGLTLIGLFASIYHPVGVAMVVAGRDKVGKVLGINGVCGNLGVAGAALVAGTLTDLAGWRAAFLVPGVVAIATGAVFVAFGRTPRRAAGPGPRSSIRAPAAGSYLRIVAVLAVATVFGGLIFHATTVALPKLFDQRLAGLAASTAGIGGIAAVVFAAAAAAQLVVGFLIDRYPIRPVFIAVACAQAPIMVLAAGAQDALLLAATLVMMALVFGEIPIHDALVARYASEEWRSRVYALKYVLSLGVSALGVPLVAFMHGSTGGFAALLVVLAAFAVVVSAAALFLPATAPARGAASAALSAPASRARW